VRTCVIFNPVAKGNKARHFRAHLDEIGAQAELAQTTSAGDARRLAADAVRSGFEIIAAAGGDGTLNEVLNGIGDVPGGFENVALAVLPLGTVNVFAREIGVPTRLSDAWSILMAGHQTRIDLPRVVHGDSGHRSTLYFAQLAGAGLDARAIELVSWSLKKKIGPGAYILAGLQALCSPKARLSVSNGSTTEQGELILIGNGRLYGGNYRLFPEADLRDGLLEVCVFPSVNWSALARCGPSLLVHGDLPRGAVRAFRGESVRITSVPDGAFQVDGELAGRLPAEFSLIRNGLRIIAPASTCSFSRAAKV
jgi:diacylglycerol kinase (ATP)